MSTDLKELSACKSREKKKKESKEEGGTGEEKRVLRCPAVRRYVPGREKRIKHAEALMVRQDNTGGSKKRGIF